jgi:hypothetical protein
MFFYAVLFVYIAYIFLPHSTSGINQDPSNWVKVVKKCLKCRGGKGPE